MSRRRLRRIGALLAALAVHAVLFVVVKTSDTRQLFLPKERVAIDVVPLPPTTMPTPVPTTEPPPEPPKPPKPPAKTPAPTTDESPAPSDPAPTPAPTTTTPPTPTTPTAPPTVETPAPTTTPESVMRLPVGPSTMDTVLGTGGPLGPRRSSLEQALDFHVDGPMTDSQAAARAATRALQQDLADDAVTAGLADDYFRTLRGHVETGWLPAMAQLNDGGASTTQLGMMRGLVEDTAAWGEMWTAYMDMAKQYANGVQPKLETARRERLRELMRSRKGAFRVHAISEVKLTQGPDGAVLLLELPLGSGHPGIDDGVRTAIENAVKAMAETPSQRMSHGRSFSSWWRLRATWTMVPPTAFFSGAGFDITPKGFTIDVPFDIKLTTNVMLLRTDARTSLEGDAPATD